MRFIKSAPFVLLFSLCTIGLHAQEITAQEAASPDTLMPPRVLTIAVKKAPPFIIKDQTGEFSGLSISLWSRIAEKIGVTYEYKEYADMVSLLKGVETGEVDLCISPVTVTANRLEDFHFSQPFYISSLGIAMHTSRSAMWVSFLKNLFSVDFFRAVAALFAILFIFGLLIWLAERNKNSEMFPKGIKGLGDGFWWSAVTMTTVGYGDKAPVTKFGRFVGLVWMFAAIILISSLTASIASALTVNTLGSSIENVEDLRKFKLATIQGSSSEAYLTANRLKFRTFETPLEALEAVALEEVDAFIYDTPIVKYFIHEGELTEKVEVLSHPLTIDYYAFVASKEENELFDEINPILLSYLNSPFWKEELRIYHSSNVSD